MKKPLFTPCLFLLCAVFRVQTALATPLDSQSVFTVEPYQKSSFSPANNETFVISVKLKKGISNKAPGMAIETFDSDVIRSNLAPKWNESAQSYQFIWDGKDQQGALVPDESYHPVITATLPNGEPVVWNAKTFSGGEEVYEFKKQYRPGVIEYNLPVASRVLIRAGVKNGAMLRTVLDWEPRIQGLHLEHWDGNDADGLQTIERNPKIAYLIVGYRLPEASIITYGNKKQSYRQYREAQKWPTQHAHYQNRLLDRNGTVVRPEFYTPVLQQKSPRIEMDLLDASTKKPVTSVNSLDDVIVKVDLNALDEVYLDQQKYEISFFIDGEFIAEEEQGFVPYSWKWSPSRLGITSGEHVLTVNISGYSGQVGVKHLKFKQD